MQSSLEHKDIIHDISFSPDGKALAACGQDYKVVVWNITDVKKPKRHLGAVRSSRVAWALAFSPNDDGRWIASAGEDSAVKVWDSHTGTFVRSFRGHTGLVSSLAFSPDGGRLVSGSRDHTVKVWDVTQLEKVPER